ncbi:hypothetical protein Ddye_028004 [Dipteronia dyeriana]|uniref:Cellulose synthase-like protein E1 n=1 Tax=Dipteronia dyeriana TaxID=168575 RepID=A0AAD9TQ58_9ROSI|nr:hypothetical protein Ddye_028004 [Dipteronia dyeriana]
MEVELHGLDGNGGPLYIGTGCSHRRDTLCGWKFDKECTSKWYRKNDPESEESLHELEDKLKVLASCTYEENPQWGKETGLKYGCPVEDVITGLSIQCKGWKSVYFNPERKAFIGVAPITLPQTLVQHKRWSEGNFLILLSKYSPAWYALGKISFGLQLGYFNYSFWAPRSLATLYYSIIPSLYLLKNVSVFPQSSSLWFIPFVYVISAKYSYSLVEFLWSGGTILGWWNVQRIWLYKRLSSYLFGFIDAILKSAGFSVEAFVITAKVADEDVSERYQNEILEFGASSPMFTIITTLAMLNFFCLLRVVKKLAMEAADIRFLDRMAMQILLCVVMVLINWPLYQALFFRQDKGKIPSSLTLESIGLALLACTCFVYLQ